MHSLKLIYFKMRALAEAPQMLMKFADLNYEYLMSWDYFDDDWEMVKPTIPFQQLPILIVDDIFMIKLMSLFDKEVKGMVPIVGNSISADNTETKKIFEWELFLLKKLF